MHSRRKTIHHVIIIHNFSTEISTLHVHYQENPIKQMLCNQRDWTGLMAIFPSYLREDASKLFMPQRLFLLSNVFSQTRMDHVKKILRLCQQTRKEKIREDTMWRKWRLEDARYVLNGCEQYKNGSKITLKRNRRWNCT